MICVFLELCVVLYLFCCGLLLQKISYKYPPRPQLSQLLLCDGGFQPLT